MEYEIEQENVSKRKKTINETTTIDTDISPSTSKKSFIPNTGEKSNFATYAFMLLISTTVLVWIALKNKKSTK